MVGKDVLMIAHSIRLGVSCRKREDTAIKEVLDLFDPEKSRIAEKPLIENERYLSGYA